MARGDSAASLAPGFRFHPTDEELVRYYLKRKVTNKRFRIDPISVIDIYKSEPWDLPGKSKLKTRDLEWYFFSALDKKYGNGSKTNRATEKGYWKTTGKDRPIRYNGKAVGMKKTLVYHQGRAPRGERSNWVMHEYRLVDEELEKAGVAQDVFVLCRIFQKSGTGPKNGEQYGAPFVEEEWDDEAATLLPSNNMMTADEMAVGDDAYAELNDLDQNNEVGIETDNVDHLLNLSYGEISNHMENAEDINADDYKHIMIRRESQLAPELPCEMNLNVPERYEVNAVPVKEEYVAESSSRAGASGFNYLVGDQPQLDATNNQPFDGLFLESNDLSNSADPESAVGFDMLEDYLNYFDADDNLTFDPSELMNNGSAASEQVPLPQKDANEETPITSQKPLPSPSNGDSDASSSKQKCDDSAFDSDTKPSFVKQTNHFLGRIPSPAAFASEFPIKGAAVRINSAQSSGSIHVTAGIIRIENLTPFGTGLEWPASKDRTVNVIFSLSLPQGDSSATSLVPSANSYSGKMEAETSRFWFILVLFWVLILSVSYKIASSMYTK